MTALVKSIAQIEQSTAPCPLLPTEIIDGVRDLPSLPGIVFELLETIDAPDAGIRLLANMVSRDQALTAKTLRIANSPFYGVSARVSTLPQAITILGFSTVRTLVIAASVMGNFPNHANPAFDFSGFWQHAIATAISARMMAPHLQVVPETAFISGLLHDIGQLVLAVRFTPVHAGVMAWRTEHDCSMLEAERAVTGTDHTEIGAALAAHWLFPQAIIDGVARHHAPATDDLGLVICLANSVAHALGLGLAADEPTPVIAASDWARTGLDAAGLERLMLAVEKEHEGICKLLLA